MASAGAVPGRVAQMAERNRVRSNESMLSSVRRRVVAGVLIVVVPAAAVLTLFVHSHPDDHDTDHHAARAIHAHLGGHAHPATHERGHGPLVTDDDDDHDRAAYLSAFIGEAIARFPVPALILHTVDPAALTERRAQSPVQVVHGHDPPALAARSGRAPPQFPAVI